MRTDSQWTARTRIWTALLATVLHAGPAFAVCCVTLEQHQRPPRDPDFSRTSNAIDVYLPIEAYVQGPPPDTILYGQAYGAVRIPNTWSGVTPTQVGTCVVRLDGDTLAVLDSEDPAHVETVMDAYGIPHPSPLTTPGWHPSAAVTALAESLEPSGPDFYWVGFASDSFYIRDIPANLMQSRVDGRTDFTVAIANAPEMGRIGLVIRGGDMAEGLGTIREVVYVDGLSVPISSNLTLVLITLSMAVAAAMLIRWRSARA